MAPVRAVLARLRSRAGDCTPTLFKPEDPELSKSNARPAAATEITTASNESIEEEQRAVALLAIAATVGAFLLVTLLLFWARPAGAQAPVQSAFVILKGKDTIGVERVTRGRASIQGDLAVQNQLRWSFVAEVADDSRSPQMAFRAYGAGAPADALPLQTGEMRIGADSVSVEVAGASGVPQRLTTAMKGRPFPLINLSFALTELMFAHARRADGASYVGKFLLLAGAGVPLDAKIEFAGSDSATLTLAGIVHRFAVEVDGRIRGGRIDAQDVTITRITGAGATKLSLGRPDYGAPADASYTAEEVTVPTRAGHMLSGTLTTPKGMTGRVPAVVTITGSGQSDRDEFLSLVPNYRPFRQLADTLGRRGIAVLRLDDRGINGSGGDIASATSADFADDIRAGVAFLRARVGIDPARIALFGHSEGGIIGPMIAATDPQLAALVIFAGPAYTGRRIIDFQLRNLVMSDAAIAADKKDSAVKAQFAAWDSGRGKTAWTKFFLDYDPLPTLKKVKAPVLVLQGGTDQQVTPEQAPIVERTLMDAGNRDVTVRIFANRNHLFLADTSGFPGGYTKLKDGRIGADVMGPLADWLVLKLALKPNP